MDWDKKPHTSRASILGWRNLGAYVLVPTAVAVMLCQGCSKRETQIPKRETQISGQIFIVTTGGDSKKLGDVIISLYAEDAIEKFLQDISTHLQELRRKKDESQAQLQAIEENIVAQQKAVAAAVEVVNTTAKQLEDAQNRFNLLKQNYEGEIAGLEIESHVWEFHTEFEKKVQAQRDGTSYDEKALQDAWERDDLRKTRLKTGIDQRYYPVWHQMEESCRSIGAGYQNSKAELEASRKRLEGAVGSNRELLAKLEVSTNLSDYFSILRGTSQTTRTDADGEFLFTVPWARRFALACSAKRRIGNNDEEFFWLMWIEPKEGKNPTILLTKSNMLSRDAPACLLNLKSTAETQQIADLGNPVTNHTRLAKTSPRPQQIADDSSDRAAEAAGKEQQQIGSVAQFDATYDFRGLKFGQSSEGISGLHFLEQHGDIKSFYRDRDEMKMGKVLLKRITYEFYKNKLYAARIESEGDANFEALSEVLKAAYGNNYQDRSVQGTHWLQWEENRVRVALFENTQTRLVIILFASKEIADEIRAAGGKS